MMKRFATLTLFCCVMAIAAHAQTFALIDMEYILQHIPAYEQANSQMEASSKKWQSEVEAVTNEAKSLYESYQNAAKSLSDVQKKQREEAIVAKEKQANDLRRKYFGQDGELFKQRESLMKPIQDQIYNAVKEISTQKGYSLVLDRASDASIIFASPTIDISDDILARLGYSN